MINVLALCAAIHESTAPRWLLQLFYFPLLCTWVRWGAVTGGLTYSMCDCMNDYAVPVLTNVSFYKIPKLWVTHITALSSPAASWSRSWLTPGNPYRAQACSNPRVQVVWPVSANGTLAWSRHRTAAHARAQALTKWLNNHKVAKVTVTCSVLLSVVLQTHVNFALRYY